MRAKYGRQSLGHVEGSTAKMDEKSLCCNSYFTDIYWIIPFRPYFCGTECIEAWSTKVLIILHILQRSLECAGYLTFLKIQSCPFTGCFQWLPCACGKILFWALVPHYLRVLGPLELQKYSNTAFSIQDWGISWILCPSPFAELHVLVSGATFQATIYLCLINCSDFKAAVGALAAF